MQWILSVNFFNSGKIQGIIEMNKNNDEIIIRVFISRFNINNVYIIIITQKTERNAYKILCFELKGIFKYKYFIKEKILFNVQ